MVRCTILVMMTAFVILTYPAEILCVDVDMDKVMEWVGLKFFPKNATGVENKYDGNCTETYNLTISLGYLRRISFYDNGTVKSREDIQKEIEAHPEFYEAKLQALKSSKTNAITCRKDRFCQHKNHVKKCGSKDQAETNEYLKEAVNLDSVEKWTVENFEMKTTWSDPKAALNKWIDVYKTIRSKLENTKQSAEEGKACSASLEQSHSFVALRRLIERYNEEGIMLEAWPKIAYYDKKFEEVLKSGGDIVFCGLKTVRNTGFECKDSVCASCSRNDCSEPGSHQEEMYNNIARAQEVNATLTNILNGPIGTPGKLTLDEAIQWNKTFSTSVAELEPCNVNAILTLARTDLIELLMRNNDENGTWSWRTQDEVKNNLDEQSDSIQNLKGGDMNWQFCGSDHYCGPDGICFRCEQKGDGDNILHSNGEFRESCQKFQSDDKMFIELPSTTTTAAPSNGTPRIPVTLFATLLGGIIIALL